MTESAYRYRKEMLDAALAARDVASSEKINSSRAGEILRSFRDIGKVFNQVSFRNIVSGIGWRSGLGVARNIANVSGIDLIPGGTKVANGFIRATEKLDDTLYKYATNTKTSIDKFANSVAQFSVRSTVRDIVRGIGRNIGWVPGLGAARNIANVSGIDVVPGGTRFANALITATDKMDATLSRYAVNTKASTEKFATSVARFSSSVAEWTKVITSVVGKFTGLSWLGRLAGRGASSLFSRGGTADIKAVVDEVSRHDIAALSKLLGTESAGGPLGQIIKQSAIRKGSVEQFLRDYTSAGGDTTNLFKQLGLKSAKQTEHDIATAMEFFSKGVGKSLGDTLAGGGGDLESMLRGFAGGGGDIAKLISGAGGGGGGASTGVVSSGGGGAGLISSISGSIMPVLIGLLVASAPFIGQIVGMAIVGVLGTGLAGFGIAGAIMSGKLTKPMQELSNTFKDFFTVIGGPMVPVLKDFLHTLSNLLIYLEPTFKTAEKIISGPLQNFLDAIVASFASPAVQQSIVTVAKAFGKMLDAITPTIGPDMDAIATAISNLAIAIAKNPKAAGDFFIGLTKIITFIINSLTALTTLAGKIEDNWYWIATLLHLPTGPPPPPASKTTTTTVPMPGLTPLLPGKTLPSTLFTLPPGTVTVTTTPVAPGFGRQVAEQISRNQVNLDGKPLPSLPGANYISKALSVLETWGKDFVDASNVIPPGVNPNAKQIHSGTRVDTIASQTQLAELFTGATPAQAKQLSQAGANIIKGVTTGMGTQAKNSGPVISKEVADQLILHINNGVGAHSPATKTIPTGKDIIGGIMQGMQIAAGGIGPWIATNVTAPIMTFLVSDVYGFGMANAGTTAGATAAATKLVPVGWGIVDGIKQGIEEEMIGIDTWGKTTIVDPIINYLTSDKGFHITSPSKKMKPIGKQIVEGLIHGMIDTAGHLGSFVAKVFGDWPKAILSFVSKGLDPTKLNPAAQKLFQSIIGGVGGAPLRGGKAIPENITRAWRNIQASGGGVTRWAGDVSKALTMLKLPQSLSGAVLYQMQTESGGDPNAINLTDSNARRGDPSRGLMQTIGATFTRWHVPGTSWNIYDPLANIASSINYAVHGKGIGSDKGQLGSGHAYDTGGWLPPGVTLAYNLTGKRERVLSHDEFDHMQTGGTEYHAHFDGLTGEAIESHVRTAFQAMSLTSGNLQRQGRRS
jgi:hypothetical protein